jgi:hypothetical protein
VVFDKMSISSYMQVIFRGTHWAKTWVVFQKEKRHIIEDACQNMTIIIIEIFIKYGWWSIKLLTNILFLTIIMCGVFLNFGRIYLDEV